MTVAIPLDTKRNVAMIDRRESRPMPQTACPLVQPFASVIPIPTSIPLMIAMVYDVSIFEGIYALWLRV